MEDPYAHHLADALPANEKLETAIVGVHHIVDEKDRSQGFLGLTERHIIYKQTDTFEPYSIYIQVKAVTKITKESGDSRTTITVISGDDIETVFSGNDHEMQTWVSDFETAHPDASPPS
jgi:hypothetical protein